MDPWSKLHGLTGEGEKKRARGQWCRSHPLFFALSVKVIRPQKTQLNVSICGYRPSCRQPSEKVHVFQTCCRS